MLLNINHSWRCVLTSQHGVMGQNLLLLPERSLDMLSFSDGAQSLYGSSSPNSVVFHTLVVRCLYYLFPITHLISVHFSSTWNQAFTFLHFSGYRGKIWLNWSLLNVSLFLVCMPENGLTFIVLLNKWHGSAGWTNWEMRFHLWKYFGWSSCVPALSFPMCSLLTAII